MPIKFLCQSCGAAIKAPDTHLGQTLPCPKCSEPVVVAAATGESSPAPTTPAPPEFPKVDEPAPVADIPEIVTREPQSHGAAPPVSLDLPTGNAFASPQTRSIPGSIGDLQDIRIVDLNLPFKSVFKFAVQFFLCNLLLGFILWLGMMLLMVFLAAVGFGLNSF